jgi:predicted nucleotidyltransferase
MRRDDAFLSEISSKWRQRNLRERDETLARKRLARDEAHRLARTFAEADRGLRRVYLFGSCLDTRRFTPSSDIDLAIEGGDLVGCVRIALDSAFPVDVIDLADAREGVRARILAEGEMLYAKEQ